MTNLELNAKVAELKELKRMAEELDKNITSIEDEIKEEMTLRGVEELILDMFKITWKTVISRRFDSTSFKKANSELYNLFTKETSAKRFLVS